MHRWRQYQESNKNLTCPVKPRKTQAKRNVQDTATNDTLPLGEKSLFDRLSWLVVVRKSWWRALSWVAEVSPAIFFAPLLRSSWRWWQSWTWRRTCASHMHKTGKPVKRQNNTQIAPPKSQTQTKHTNNQNTGNPKEGESWSLSGKSPNVLSYYLRVTLRKKLPLSSEKSTRSALSGLLPALLEFLGHLRWSNQEECTNMVEMVSSALRANWFQLQVEVYLLPNLKAGVIVGVFKTQEAHSLGCSASWKAASLHVLVEWAAHREMVCNCPWVACYDSPWSDLIIWRK